jgi:hypothetical protein
MSALAHTEEECRKIDLLDPRDRLEEEDNMLILWDEIERLRRGWRSDQEVLRGALQLLKEAGLSPGSAELIAAAERFNHEQ